MSTLLAKAFSTARSSLLLTISAFQIACTLPEMLYFAYLLHADGELTAGMIVSLVVLGVSLNGLAGLLFWFTVVEPIRKSRLHNKPGSE